MSNENVAMKFEPGEFEKTELFNGYSEFCQNVIKNLNNKIPDKYKNYFICTRNGTDPKITFKEFNHEERVILTLTPNKTCNHALIEIRERKSKPFKKKITCDKDIAEVIFKI